MKQTSGSNLGMRKAAISLRIGMAALITAIPLGVIFGLDRYGLVSIPSVLAIPLVVSIIVLILSHFVLRIVAARFTT